MHPRAYAERRAIAQQRQRIAATAIAKALDIEEPAQVRERDANIRILKESESMAEWLESIAITVDVEPETVDLRSLALASTDDELKELGLSATAIKKLRDSDEGDEE